LRLGPRLAVGGRYRCDRLFLLRGGSVWRITAPQEARASGDEDLDEAFLRRIEARELRGLRDRFSATSGPLATHGGRPVDVGTPTRRPGDKEES
jgi:hypothetical protein